MQIEFKRGFLSQDLFQISSILFQKGAGKAIGVMYLKDFDTNTYAQTITDDNGCSESTETEVTTAIGQDIGSNLLIPEGACVGDTIHFIDISILDSLPEVNNGNFTLDIELIQKFDLSISIYNIQGHRILNHFEKDIEKLSRDFKLKENGVNFMHLKLPREIKIIKVVVSK